MQRALERTKTALQNARENYRQASNKHKQEHDQFLAAQRTAMNEYQKHIEGERLQREANQTLVTIRRLEQGNETRNRQIRSNNATIAKNVMEIGNLINQIQRMTRDIQTLKNNPEVKVAEANQLPHPSLTNLRTLEGRLRVITQRKAGLETQNTNLLRQNERIKTETDRATASLNTEKQKQERFAAQAKTLGINIA